MKEKKEKETRKTAIYFTCSLKWDKNENKINTEEILNEWKGTHEIYAITHKIGTEDEHTHYFIKCGTPRTIENVANIFNVDAHMIRYVLSKRASLRYLCHLDNPEKEQYLPEEVITNSTISYMELIGKFEITKKEILNDLIFTQNIYESVMKYIEIIEPNELNSLMRIAKEIKREHEIKFLKKN